VINDSYQVRALTVRSNNNFYEPRAITLSSDNFSPQILWAPTVQYCLEILNTILRFCITVSRDTYNNMYCCEICCNNVLGFCNTLLRLSNNVTKFAILAWDSAILSRDSAILYSFEIQQYSLEIIQYFLEICHNLLRFCNTVNIASRLCNTVSSYWTWGRQNIQQESP
jgi:hypothetical protein